MVQASSYLATPNPLEPGPARYAIVWGHPRTSVSLLDAPRVGSSPQGLWHNGKYVSRAELAVGDVVRVDGAVGVVVTLPDNASQPWFSEPFSDLLVGPLGHATWQRLEQLAMSDQPVVLEGPSGVGKHTLARALHQMSGRSGELVSLQYTRDPQGLVELRFFDQAVRVISEKQAAMGLLNVAQGGTLLVDEFGELPSQFQGELLQLLRGAKGAGGLGARLVVVCRRPLLDLGGHQLPADLRVQLVRSLVTVPPLRQRRQDIIELFCRRSSARGGGPRERGSHADQWDPRALSAEFYEALCLYDWPENVRQLLEVAEHPAIAALHAGLPAEAQLAQLRLALGDELPKERPVEADVAMVEAADVFSQARRLLGLRRAAWLERHWSELLRLLEVMGSNGRNVSRAARSVGISRQRAGRLLDAHAVLQEAAVIPARSGVPRRVAATSQQQSPATSNLARQLLVMREDGRAQQHASAPQPSSPRVH